MKVYLISHSGKPSWMKLCSWVDTQKVGKNGIYIESVRAFIRKKDAKKWLDEEGLDHLKVITAEII